jgi:KRAB domain-containing zinc finger protein
MENIDCDVEGKGGSQFESARENWEGDNQPEADDEEGGGGDADVDDRSRSDEKGGENQFAVSIQCSDCNKTFTRENNYKTHHLNKHGNSDHVCVTCGRKFRTVRALKKHLQFGKYCKLKCVLCTRTFKRKNDLEKHEEKCKYANDTGGVCGLCEESFQYSYDLERHRKYATYANGSSIFVCWQCNKHFCSLNLLMGHRERDHAGPESREIWKKVLNDRGNGVKGSFPDKVFPCEKCGESFSSKETMMTHLSSHSVKANTKTSFKRQRARVTDDLECMNCNTKFSLWKNYQRHRSGVYDGEQNPLNLCEICGEIHCTRKLLKGHQKLAHEDYSCPVCEKKFKTKRNLERHIKNAYCHKSKTVEVG